jgi:Reverse transcriptase (RNA-dependent DNA polymerase)
VKYKGVWKVIDNVQVPKDRRCIRIFKVERNGTIIDIETAFLYDKLDEEIYMDIPSGLNVGNNKKLILQKTLYSLVQGARKLYRRLIEVLQVIGYTGSKSDTNVGLQSGKHFDHRPLR